MGNKKNKTKQTNKQGEFVKLPTSFCALEKASHVMAKDLLGK